MPRFAANLSMLYNAHAFLDRFAAAAADGYTAVEYLFPYALAAEDLAARLREHGLQQVLFNAPPGADRNVLQNTDVANLARAAAQGVALLIEPINTRDIPGFFLNRQDHAHESVADVGAANLKVQTDLYRCQIVEGDLAKKLERCLPGGAAGLGWFQPYRTPRQP